MLIVVPNVCLLKIILYSTCINLDKSIVTRCDNTDANEWMDEWMNEWCSHSSVSEDVILVMTLG